MPQKNSSSSGFTRPPPEWEHLAVLGVACMVKQLSSPSRRLHHRANYPFGSWGQGPEQNPEALSPCWSITGSIWAQNIPSIQQQERGHRWGMSAHFLHTRALAARCGSCSQLSVPTKRCPMQHLLYDAEWTAETRVRLFAQPGVTRGWWHLQGDLHQKHTGPSNIEGTSQAPLSIRETCVPLVDCKTAQSELHDWTV